MNRRTRPGGAVVAGLVTLVSLGLLAGCRACTGAEAIDREPCPALDPPAPWLVLRAIDEQRGLVRMLPLELSAAAPVPHPARELPAEPIANWPGHYRASVAHAGRLLAAATPVPLAGALADARAPALADASARALADASARALADASAPALPDASARALPDAGALADAGPGEGRPLELVLLRLDDPASPLRHVPLAGLRPVALHLLGFRRVVIGSPGRTASLDLTERPPRARPLDGVEGAALSGAGPTGLYLFARAGNRLVTLAGEPSLSQAEALEVDCQGAVVSDQRWFLPGLVNGSYSEALIDGDELLLVAHYDVVGGSGHLLARIALDRLSDRELGNLTLNLASAGRPPLVEEFDPEPSEPDLPTRVLAGARMTPWAGLGVLGKHVLLGAADRGVLVLDRQFGGEDRALAVDVDGRCLDLAVRGDSAYVLVESSGQTAVRRLVFDRSRGRLVVAGITSVPGVWESFVR